MAFSQKGSMPIWVFRKFHQLHPGDRTWTCIVCDAVVEAKEGDWAVAISDGKNYIAIALTDGKFNELFEPI